MVWVDIKPASHSGAACKTTLKQHSLIFIGSYLVKDFTKFEKYGITGPKAYPIIGTALPMMTKGLWRYDLDMYMTYKEKRVCRVFDLGSPGLVICDVKLAKEILIKQFSHFMNRKNLKLSRPPFDRSLIIICDDHWRHVRNHVSPTFSGSKMKMMTPLIQKCANALSTTLLEKAKTHESFDCKHVFSSYTMDVIASTMFGMDIDSLNNPDHPAVERAKAMLSLGTIRTAVLITLMMINPKILVWLSKLGLGLQDADSLDYFTKHMNEALTERRNQEGTFHDFLALMTKSEVDDEQVDRVSNGDVKWSTKGLTKTDIVAQMMIFFVAGYETTSATMMLVAYHMAKYEHLQQRLRDEVDEVLGDEEPNYENVQKLTYLDMFINETTRLYPQAPRISREASDDVVIDGITIPKGTAIWIPAWAIHRDPEIWPDPEKFDPERFSAEQKADRDPGAFMPFSQGPRNCVGMRLAVLEIRIGLAKILQKCKLVFDDDTPSELKLQKFRVAPAKPLKLKVESR